MIAPASAVTFRPESPDDASAIRAVIAAAFGTAEEADLVERLRAAKALIFSGVAESGGEIVGHIAYSRVQVGETDAQSEALALAPVAVLPAWQRRGVGSELIRWSLREVERLGGEVVIVLGHSAYYPRFGFVPAGQHGIRCPFPVPDGAFMVRELTAGALANVRGLVRYHPAFDGL